MDDSAEKEINYWLPTGIGLLVIGLLTLATPLFGTLSNQELLIDMIAGSFMTLTGLAGVIISRKQSSKTVDRHDQTVGKRHP